MNKIANQPSRDDGFRFINGLNLFELIDLEKQVYAQYENAAFDDDASDLHEVSQLLKRIIQRDRSQR